MTSQNLTYKEKWQRTIRALMIQYQINRPFFLYNVLSSFVDALKPFAGIWFSALFLSELSGQQRNEMLLLWAACGAGITFLLWLLAKWLEHRKQAHLRPYWHKTEHLYAEKMLSMDYEDVERSEVHQLRSQIDQNDNFNNFGLNAPLFMIGDLVSALTGIFASVALTVTLFRTKFPVPSPLSWLNAPWVTAAVLCIMAGTVFVSVRASSRYAKTINSHTSMEYYKKSNRLWIYYGFRLPDQLKAGMDIRLYGMDQSLKNNMEQHYALSRQTFRLIDRERGLCKVITQLVSYLNFGTIYAFAALKALGHAFPVGNLVQYVGAIHQFSQSIRSLSTTMTLLLQNADYLQVTYDFLDIPNQKYMGTIPVEKRTDNEYEVEFRNVSYRYPGSPDFALKNLNFRFKLGTKLAVVGMNGSGKTTMIKLLCRLYDPTEGEILLNGINIQKYDYDEYMSLFSVVFQDFQLFSFTLGENVAASRSYDREKVLSCLRQAGFEQRLQELPQGLDTYLNQNFEPSGVTLSGGEGQKVALARALYKDAPFVVLDEPTAALDPLAEYEIYTRFNEMVGDKTAVYISHRLSSCRFCDEIAVFHQGHLVQYGTHPQLLSDSTGKYYELWNAQAQYYVSR